MGIQQLSISRIKGKMKHKLSSSIREKKRGNGRWQLRERGRGEWNGKWLNKWLVYYNKRQAQWIIKTSIIILHRFYGC